MRISGISSNWHASCKGDGMPLHPSGKPIDETRKETEMNRYNAKNPVAAVTALVLSVLISATFLMAYTNVSIADIGQVTVSKTARTA
jgi:hypothetical protein